MAGRLAGIKVVLVDDDADVLQAMAAVFEAEGAITRTVADGNEAVRVCQEDPPELVVLDMMLPKRSGFLVLEKIKGYEDAPIVIMLTANEGRRHQAYAESLGVDTYMLKPVPLERLLAKSAELLAARAAEKAAPAAKKPRTKGADAADGGDAKPAKEAKPGKSGGKA